MTSFDDLKNLLLFKTLAEKMPNNDVISLISIIEQVVKQCDSILPRYSDTFTNFTLHNPFHSLKVVKRMGQIIPSETLNQLNIIEITILVLSAFLHDIGMVQSRKEANELLLDSDFLNYRKGEKKLNELIEQSKTSENYRLAQDLEDTLIMNYIRKIHGKRGKEKIIQLYENIMIYKEVSFAKEVGQIVESHSNDAYLINEKDPQTHSFLFPINKPIGDELKINLQYLAICLRLADILDFDRERTPSILFDYLSPSDSVTLEEWNKHLSVEGLVIDEFKDILCSCECTHPTYQRCIHDFLDIIENEIISCTDIVKGFPSSISKTYTLYLKTKIHRSDIKSKGYIYGDFRFIIKQIK